jgi:hypothetical protein
MGREKRTLVCAIMIQMGSVRALERIRAGAIAVAFSALACGQSEFAGGDDGAAGETQGGSGNGGAPPIGGMGNAGSGAVGGIVTGTGGAPSCPDCPVADYGLVIEGDGEDYAMRFNGFIDPTTDPMPSTCGEQPLRGWVGGCGRSIVLFACEDPASGRPCLEISDGVVRYVDRGRGQLFIGNVTSDVPGQSTSFESGTLTLTLRPASGTGELLVLTVRYAFCPLPLYSVKIVC